MSDGDSPLLEVRNLEKHYPIAEGVPEREVGRVRAVDGISFTIERGETFGLVGESGCGKSTAATVLLHLEEPTGGSVLFDGEDVTEYSRRERKRFRCHAQMVFQDPESSFDPCMTIGESVAEPLRVSGIRDRDRRRELVERLLVRVGLEAEDADRYPHEFSGGQKQRIGLARALVVDPDLLVADEPVSALDVSIQAEILSLMEELQAEFGLGMLLISHNLAVVREICDAVGVMYLGEIVEQGPVEGIVENPSHPYTRALLSSIPTPDPHDRRGGVELTGDVPSPSDPPPGCRFHTRCPEIVPPDDTFEPEQYRRVADFAQRVYDGSIDPASIRWGVVTETPGVQTSEDVDPEAFEARLRDEFDIPEPIEPIDADETLSEAARLVYEERIDAAADRLRTKFETPCRQEAPEHVAVDSDHLAACHRLDDRFADRRGVGTRPVGENAGSHSR